MQAAEKIYNANLVLEAARDRMLGFNTPLSEYTIGDDGNIIKNKVKKITDTILLYILREDPLLNKNEIRFIKTALLSIFYFASNRESLPEGSLTFKTALSAASILEEAPDDYAELITAEYFTLHPDFMMANLDGEATEEGQEIEIEVEKLMKISEEQENEIRKGWEKDHPNSLLAEEILANDQKLFETYEDMPEQFYTLIETALCAFLADEKKQDWAFYDTIRNISDQA